MSGVLMKICCIKFMNELQGNERFLCMYRCMYVYIKCFFFMHFASLNTRFKVQKESRKKQEPFLYRTSFSNSKDRQAGRQFS